MNVGFVGTGPWNDVREEAAARVSAVEGPRVEVPVVALPAGPAPAEAPASGLEALLRRTDAVFIAGPTATHARVAEAATKQGVHAFLEWPPATSVRECQAIVRLAEEAGVEVGVSRPMRFHPAVRARAGGRRAALIVLQGAVARSEPAVWSRWLAAALDLCCALAQSSSVQRVDAEAVRSGAAWPDAVAFGLRFHSGSYAQVSLRRDGSAPHGTLFAAAPGFQVDAALPATEQAMRELVAAETHAFLSAVAAGRPAPVSVLDGLHTMRLVERLMSKLR